jgi:hypothetical protein
MFCPPESGSEKGLNHRHKAGTMARKPAQTKASTGAHWIGNPRLLPLKDAAQWLGLTVWSLRERIWAGDIPVVRFPGGRKQFIDVQDLEDFVQKNKMTIR